MTLNQLKYAIEIEKKGSINEAAKCLFISQPSLTSSLKSLEQEVGFDIFMRSTSGMALTVKGEEFLGYAKSVVEQYEILDAKYISKENVKRTFHVSTQHYTFAVNAFINVIKEYGMDEFEFEVHETKTYDVIDNVRNQRSEIGVLYMNSYNSTVLKKMLSDADLTFTPLFNCSIYVYMSKKNPLAKKKIVTLDDLEPYPCMAFSQGEHNSFYFSEEILSTMDCEKEIVVRDRATLFNLLIGLDGYTICSGVISEELNGPHILARPLDVDDYMEIGYIMPTGLPQSVLTKKYIHYLQQISKIVQKNDSI